MFTTHAQLHQLQLGTSRRRPLGNGRGRLVRLCLGLSAIAVAAAGCGTSRPVHRATTENGPPAQTSRSGLLRSTTSLPTGTFYLLAGPKSGWSNNVWQVTGSGGKQAELTHTRPNYGIDALAGSHAGIAVANASTGTDEVDRLTKHGMIPMPGGHGDPWVVTAAGAVYLVSFDQDGSRLEVDKTFTSKPSLMFQQKDTIGAVAQGPGSRIVFQSFPVTLVGHHGPIYEVREMLGRRRWRALDAHIPDPQVPIWSPNAIGLSINSRKMASVRGIVLEHGDHYRRMPLGWRSLAWSPNGRLLLLQKGQLLGLWNPLTHNAVRIVARTTGDSVVDRAVWLSSPARIPG